MVISLVLGVLSTIGLSEIGAPPTLLRLYYSKGRIMSWEARERWVEPDLAPLPVRTRR